MGEEQKDNADPLLLEVVVEDGADRVSASAEAMALPAYVSLDNVWIAVRVRVRVRVKVRVRVRVRVGFRVGARVRVRVRVIGIGIGK
jgi:hypothetical protein